MSGGTQASGSEPSLRQQAARGARWTAGSTFAIVALQIVQFAALARLLSPREFGLATSAMVIVGLAQRIGDGGISNAIIAKQTEDRDVLSSLYWANVIVGILAASALLACIPLAQDYFDEEQIGSLLVLAAPASVIAALGQQYSALLQKALNFGPLASAEAASVVAGTVAAIALAALGAGAASFIGGYLVQTVVRTGWLVLAGWSTAKPRARLRRDDLRGYLNFGLYQLGDRVTNYLGSNLDYALIGGFLGTRALGVYSVAFRLVTIPQRLGPILTRVAFPVFSRRRDDDLALRRGYLELTRLIAFCSMPLMAGFAVTAPQLVPVAFGSGWADSVAILQVLSIAGVFFSLAHPNGSVFYAKSRPDLGMKLNILRLVLVAIALVPAVSSGLLTVAWAFVGVVGLMFLITRVVLGRLIGLRMRDYASALLQPSGISAAMGVVLLVATPALDALLSSDAALLLAQFVLGVAIFASGLAIFARHWALETWELVSGSRRSVAPPSAA